MDPDVLVARIVGLVAARDLIDNAIDSSVSEAIASGASRAKIAAALQVHRSSIYRSHRAG